MARMLRPENEVTNKEVPLSKGDDQGPTFVYTSNNVCGIVTLMGTELQFIA